MSRSGELVGYEAAVAIAAAGIAALFTIGLWRRHLSRRRTNRALAHWAISLAMFAIASTALALGAATGWSGASYRTFYLFGGVLVVPWLALGTVETVSRDPVTTRVLAAVSLGTAVLFAVPMLRADDPVLYGIGVALGLLWGFLLLTGQTEGIRAGSVAIIGTFSAVAAFAVLAGRVLGPLPTEGLPDPAKVFEAGVRGFAVAGNALGALLVVIGSVMSAVRLRGQDVPHLVAGNVLIALGVLVAGAGGAFAFVGDIASHAVAFGIGVALMYAGFVRTTRAPVSAGHPPPEPERSADGEAARP